jgi:hypothetical protein
MASGLFIYHQHAEHGLFRSSSRRDATNLLPVQLRQVESFRRRSQTRLFLLYERGVAIVWARIPIICSSEKIFTQRLILCFIEKRTSRIFPVIRSPAH